MTIKAIETVYNGYRFRSRLEARWAVFFDTLGVTYEYEKEGYDLGEAGWYLPDFWLETVHMWAEIKPCAFTEQEYGKCAALARGTGHAVLMLDGEPNHDRMYPCVTWGPEHTLIDEIYPGATIEEIIQGDWYEFLVTLDDSYIHSEHRWWASEGHRPWEYDASETTKAAYLAARQARFEHGETPQRVNVRVMRTNGVNDVPMPMPMEQLPGQRERAQAALVKLREYVADPTVNERDRRAASFRLRSIELKERIMALDAQQRIVEVQNDVGALRELIEQKQTLLMEWRALHAEIAASAKPRRKRFNP